MVLYSQENITLNILALDRFEYYTTEHRFEFILSALDSMHTYVGYLNV